tara:strand:- start:10 stop:345 length:336 start_codon:yes stop_codon:yes gene_type:complete
LNRLKGKQNITALFNSGEKIIIYPLCLYYKKKNNMAYGISAGKRSFSLAVERNKIKRLLREGARKHLFSAFDCLEDNFHFIVLYIDKKKPDSNELEEGFKRLVEQIKKDLF